MPEHFPAVAIQPILNLLGVPKRIVITTHHRPDGDAMGSSLGLYNYLLLKGHRVTVITPSSYPDFLYWLPGNEKVVNFESRKEEAIKEINKAEVIFCLDFNWMDRAEKLADPLRQATAVKILIDHHLDPEQAFDHIFSYSDSCATCELIYQFIDDCGDSHFINKSIAECLYCGIMTDTNSFRYETMRSSTHRIIAKLMDAGAENFKIHERVYDNFSENRLRLLGYSVKDKLVVLNDYKAAYIALSENELNMYNFKTGDTEGIVNYALSIHGIRLAALFMERDGLVKISFRSKDDFSVKELSVKYFNGGGHRNAAGGHSTQSLAATVQTFLDVLPFYKVKLIG